MKEYSKPKVTIDLEEYEELLKSRDSKMVLIPHRIVKHIDGLSNAYIEFILPHEGVIKAMISRYSLFLVPGNEVEFYIKVIKNYNDTSTGETKTTS